MARCLDSLHAQSRLPNELVVVDSGSDDTPQLVERFRLGNPSYIVKYLRSAPGLTRQRNIGIAAADGNIVHFMDDDVILDPDYLKEIQQTFEDASNQAVLAVIPAIQLPRKTHARSLIFRRLFFLPLVNGNGRLQKSGFGSYTWYSNISGLHRVEVGCGCGCAFRREVFEKILYDTWFKDYGYMEDLDFTYRVGRLGPILCNPMAKMLHMESPSARLNQAKLVEMQIVNHYYFFQKHMPQDILHWTCFWWSELGESLRRLAGAAKGRNLSALTGMIRGYRLILFRGKKLLESNE